MSTAQITANDTFEPLLLTARQVGALLGIGKSTVYEYGENRIIPAPLQMGRSKRWRRSDIEQFVDKGSTPSKRKAV